MRIVTVSGSVYSIKSKPGEFGLWFSGENVKNEQSSKMPADGSYPIVGYTEPVVGRPMEIRYMMSDESKIWMRIKTTSNIMEITEL